MRHISAQLEALRAGHWPDGPPGSRIAALAARLDAESDKRVRRYWELQAWLVVEAEETMIEEAAGDAIVRRGRGPRRLRRARRPAARARPQHLHCAALPCCRSAATIIGKSPNSGNASADADRNSYTFLTIGRALPVSGDAPMPMLAHFEELPQHNERRRSVRRALKLGLGAGAEEGHHPRSVARPARCSRLRCRCWSAQFRGRLAAGAAGSMRRSSGTAANFTAASSICRFRLRAECGLLQSGPRSPESMPADPLTELRELNAEVELLALKMESALKRLKRK